MTDAYAKTVADYAERIQYAVKCLSEQRKKLDDLNSPRCNVTIWLGYHAPLMRDGKPNPRTETIRQAWINCLQDEILSTKSVIEGLRYKINQIAKEAIQ